MVFLLVSTVIAMTLMMGLRIGITSGLFLFAIHVTIGFGVRLLVVSFVDVPDYFYWSVLSRNFNLPIEIISLQLSLAIIFTLIGYAAINNSSVSRYTRSIFNIITPNQGNVSLIISFILFIFCWSVFFTGLTAIYGSPLSALSALQRRALTFGSSVTILRIFITVAFAPLIVIIVESFRLRSNYWALRAFSLFIVLMHLIGVFLTGGRGAMLTQAFVISALIMLILSRNHLRITIATSLAAIAASVLMVTVVIGGYAIRISAQRDIPLPLALQQALPDSMLIVSGTFPILDMYSGAYVLTRDEGISYGENLLNIGGRFVPRDFWPSKPDIVAIQIRQHVYGDRLSGAPPTAYGEFYYAFSWVGLIVSGLIIGSILKILDGIRGFVIQRPISAGIYFYFIFQISFGVIKSGFENSLFHMIYFSFGMILIKVASHLLPNKRVYP